MSDLAPAPLGLDVRALRKRRGEVLAIDRVDLEVRRGEVVALVGPNGAGKTTLMHLVAGLLAPDEGEVRVDGARDPRRVQVRARLGYAAQSASLYDELSARENLVFFAQIHGVVRAEVGARVAWALAFSGLSGRADDRVRTFSGGMKRRLHVVCAVLHAPPLVLLDEPTAGVDPQSRNHLLEGVEALRDAGHAVLYATHHMDEARRIADRIAVVDHGRIAAIGTPAHLSRDHAGDLEAAFLALTGTALRDHA